MPKTYFSNDSLQWVELRHTRNKGKLSTSLAAVTSAFLLLIATCDIGKAQTNYPPPSTESQSPIAQNLQSLSNFTLANGERIIDELAQEIEQQNPSTTNLLSATGAIKGEGNYSWHYTLLKSTDVWVDRNGEQVLFVPGIRLVAARSKHFLGDNIDAFTTLANFPCLIEYRNKMVQLLSSTNPAVRMAAAINLRGVPDNSLVPALTSLLKDPDPEVRLAGVVALGSTPEQFRSVTLQEDGWKTIQPYANDQVYSALKTYLETPVRPKDVPFILDTLENIPVDWPGSKGNDLINLVPIVHSADKDMEEYLETRYRRLSHQIEQTSNQTPAPKQLPPDMQKAVDAMAGYPELLSMVTSRVEREQPATRMSDNLFGPIFRYKLRQKDGPFLLLNIDLIKVENDRVVSIVAGLGTKAVQQFLANNLELQGRKADAFFVLCNFPVLPNQEHLFIDLIKNNTNSAVRVVQSSPYEMISSTRDSRAPSSRRFWTIRTRTPNMRRFSPSPRRLKWTTLIRFYPTILFLRTRFCRRLTG